ncbi:MAG: hypothetical protein ACMXYL_03045 [Candidatus Woesearchaeota archaeon]
MKRIIIILSVVLVVLLLLFFSWYYNLAGTVYGYDSISYSQCTRRGGEIINTLLGDTCPEGTVLYAEVHGTRCPCICCVPE